MIFIWGIFPFKLNSKNHMVRDLTARLSCNSFSKFLIQINILNFRLTKDYERVGHLAFVMLIKIDLETRSRSPLQSCKPCSHLPSLSPPCSKEGLRHPCLRYRWKHGFLSEERFKTKISLFTLGTSDTFYGLRLCIMNPIPLSASIFRRIS